jgi:predicted MFS family arabinose efflux permease
MSIDVADRRRQSLLLAAFTAVAFLTSTSPLAITPFLLSIAADLGSDLTIVSVLFTFTNLAWATSGLAAGQISDRLGRKPLILLGLFLMGLGGLGTALAVDYETLALSRLLMGIGGGCQMSTLFAAAADLFPASSRGRSLGWIMTGQSLALVVGTPVAALIGSFADWRLATGIFGAACLLAVLLLFWLVPAPERTVSEAGPRETGIARLVANPRVLTLFGAVLFERICYSTVVLFFATYLLAVYQLPYQWLAVALVVVAIGNVGGNQLGGRVTDRIQARHRVAAASMASNGLLALPLLAAAPGVLISVGLGLLYSLANGFGRPILMWLVTDISREARGAVLGVHITVSASGWLIASAFGGWFITTYGFGALGLAAFLCGFASASLAWLSGLIGERAAARSVEAGGAPSTG